MQAEFMSIHDLFSGTVQYEIPTYQRNYVWNEKDQWKPLRMFVLKRYLNQLIEVPLIQTQNEKSEGRVA